MNFSNPLVEEVKSKVDSLITQRNDMRNAIRQMEEQMANMSSQLKEKEDALIELEQKVKVIKLAKSLDGEQTEDSRDLKLKINEMVREIDKCIALLNK